MWYRYSFFQELYFIMIVIIDGEAYYRKKVPFLVRAAILGHVSNVPLHLFLKKKWVCILTFPGLVVLLSKI